MCVCVCAATRLLHFCSNLLGQLCLLCGTEVGILPDQFSVEEVLHGATVQLVLGLVLPAQLGKAEEGEVWRVQQVGSRWTHRSHCND